MTRRKIKAFRKIVLPFISKLLLDIDYEGQGKCDAEEFAKDFNEILDLATKALEQEPKTGDWISVNERLPENTQPVLMTIRRMSKLYNHEPFITVGYISWNQTTWWSAHDGDCVRNEIEVLAWMPLPEPYKAESEDKK